MSEWHVESTEGAVDQFVKLDKVVRQQIDARIRWFVEHFDDTKVLPLHEDFKGCFKLRAGDWRIAYTCDPKAKKLTIRVIDHRSKIYKKTP